MKVSIKGNIINIEDIYAIENTIYHENFHTGELKCKGLFDFYFKIHLYNQGIIKIYDKSAQKADKLREIRQKLIDLWEPNQKNIIKIE